MWTQWQALWYAAPRVFATMRGQDVAIFLGTLLAVAGVGVVVIVLLLRWLGPSTPVPVAPKRQLNAVPLPAVLDNKIRRDFRQRHALAGLAARAMASAVAAGDGEVERKVREARRDIPRGAAHQVVERGARLLAEESFEEALVCYLALLFAAVGDDDGPAQGVLPRNDSLPAHLTQCLRGVAMAFRGLGDAEMALKFLEVERLVFEEMIASTLGTAPAGPPGATGPANALHTAKGPPVFLDANGHQVGTPQQGSAIVNSLFKTLEEEQKDAADSKLPRRYFVLRDVALSCIAGGYAKVALSYRVKAAAIRRRATGEAMDPEGEDFRGILEAVRLCEKQGVQGDVLLDDAAAAAEVHKLVDAATAAHDDHDGAPAEANYDGDDDDGARPGPVSGAAAAPPGDDEDGDARDGDDDRRPQRRGVHAEKSLRRRKPHKP